jgi:hypothetical protein
MHTGEIAVQATLHPTGLWITVPVTVAQGLDLAPVFDSGSPMSAINPEVHALLESRGLIHRAARPNTYRIAGPTVQDQRLPDLEVRVMPRLTRLRIHGLLGLNYLGLFEWVHVHVPALRIMLQPPQRTGG